MSEHRNVVEIASDGFRALVDPLGAELHALRDGDGRDLLWDGEPAVWSGRAPVLFPIVGSLVEGRYRLNGATFSLNRHGFARRKTFEVVAADAASVVMRLGADADTRLCYPFEFELELGFAVHAATLSIEATIRNLGAGPMPASFGFHPAFRWPLPYGQPRADHTIDFARPEPAAVRRLDPQGLLKPLGEPTPVVGRRLTLRDDLFAADAVIFDLLASRTLRYGPEQGRSLEIAFPDTSYLGVWTKPGAGFIAIEPWRGVSDPVGFTGDLWEKPGTFEVPAGGARRVSMSITLAE